MARDGASGGVIRTVIVSLSLTLCNNLERDASARAIFGSTFGVAVQERHGRRTVAP